MNSLVSFDWLSEYVDLKGITPEEFARRMSVSGPSVEKIILQGDDLDRIVVGYVTDVKPHPNADKLRIAVVDVGAQFIAPKFIASNKKGVMNHAPTKRHRMIEIVCGGTNLKKDQWVAVALIGAKVRWHGEGDLVTLEPIAIRGVKSEGMICAANEIGLFDAFPHVEREILDLEKELGWDNVGATPRGRPKNGQARGPAPTSGTPLADLLGLSHDVVMDIEVTSNRVDAMGIVGLAREAGAIFKRKNSSPNPLLLNQEEGVRGWRYKRSGLGGVTVKISAKKHCARYMAAKIEGVTVGPSPWWLKRRLLSVGLRPINNLVDISNYVMREFAQPTHVFDAAKLEGGIDVRLARANEKIMALDGKTYQLDDSILVIADAKRPIAIAGVMGGEATGVTSETKDVVIEVANFDPITIRRGARKLNIQSDAQMRFEKGLSTEACPGALARVVELILELAGGRLTGPVTDVRHTRYKPLKFSITVDEVNALIGVQLAQKEIVETLRRLGFHVTPPPPPLLLNQEEGVGGGVKKRTVGKKITATVPWWRDHDIESGRDLVEEIARVYGYANIPGEIPLGLAPRPMDPELVWERRARDISKGAGLTEIYTYSFVSKELLAKARYDTTKMLHVQNPLSTDFEVMRTTLLPSLLAVAAENQERVAEQRLFEIAKVYYPPVGATPRGRPKNGQAQRPAPTGDDLPDEQLEIGALFVGMKDSWRVAKGYVEYLLAEMGIKKLSWRRLSTDTFWHPGRTVQAFSAKGGSASGGHHGDLVATVGEVSPQIAQNFKIEKRVALVDIPLQKVIPFATASKFYTPLPEFPVAKRDLAIIVDHRVEFDDISSIVYRLSSIVSRVEWFDTYRGKNLPDGKKSIAMHLEFSAPDRTLEAKDVEHMMEKISLAVKEKFKAEVRE